MNLRRYLPFVTPLKKLGYSTFKLVEGHTVRGPMWIFCELRTKEVSGSEI